MNARALAAQLLTDVLLQGKSLTNAMTQLSEQRVEGGDQAWVQEICFGVLRWYFRLDTILQSRLQKALKSKDTDIKCLMLAGLYQLIYMRVPDHAAVSETVKACEALNKTWAKGLVNAVLRGYARQSETINAQLNDDPVAKSAHPRWLFERLRQAWPRQYMDILTANNERAPLTLRVNLRRNSREQYLQRLQAAGFAAAPCHHSVAAVVLDKPVNVEQLPGFAEGCVSVQDEAAQLAAGLLDLQPAQRVLDVCAAPGGKTAHILESEPELAEVVALDLDEQRVEKLRETLQRLDLSASLFTGDARQPQQWWDGRLFDRVLLDAPCSASGVIRRHPDIKVLRRSSDMAALVQQQQEILQAVWPLLKCGGRLVYATCSVLPEENEAQIKRFMDSHSDVNSLPIDAEWGRQVNHGRQILPGEFAMDGFYYACLQKC